jgi:hypothetical protein
MGRSAQAAPRLTFRRPSLSRRRRHLRRRLPMSMTASGLPGSCSAAGAAAALAAVAVPAPWRGGGRERIRGRRCSPWRRRVKPGHQRARRRIMRLGFSWRMFSRSDVAPKTGITPSEVPKPRASRQRVPPDRCERPMAGGWSGFQLRWRACIPFTRHLSREADPGIAKVCQRSLTLRSLARISRSSPPRPRAATAG